MAGSAKSATLRLPAARWPPVIRWCARSRRAKDGLTAEVIDLGRGTPDEFAEHAGEIKGRIVLVRHELMFAAGTIHRRRKYDMARANGAVGFLIAGRCRAMSWRVRRAATAGPAFPALGIAPETAAKLARRADGLADRHHDHRDRRGAGRDRDAGLRVSRHDRRMGGAVGAMSTATISPSSRWTTAPGLASVLAVTRALSPEVAKWRRGLRVMFFSVEEWALTGSAQYVQALSGRGAGEDRAQRQSRLRSPGSPNLAALSSGYAGVEPFLLQVAAANGQSLRTVRPLMTNSDHANFAAGGIPAIRLVAGFDDPNAHLRVVLTPADTRDKVAQGELRQATLLTAALVAAACNADPAEAATLAVIVSPLRS